jgi:ribosomal protein L11 methyltransferase
VQRGTYNPFLQQERYWRVVFDVPMSAAATAEESFTDLALAVSGFETDEKNEIWTIDVLCADKPDEAEFMRRLSVIAKLHGFSAPSPRVEQVVQQDWLAAVARDFPPLSVGRFYVHGAHVVKPPPYGMIAIQVDAGAAFGSGEHGTTRTCLEALEWLARRHSFSRVLDLGCGSGILAIAAAKLWHAEVLAADIDSVAVRVSAENVRINRVSAQVKSVVSDGYASGEIKRRQPFDLIIANILARPLVSLAADLARALAPGGVAVLSGLLVDQETMVRSAHQLQGLRLHKRFVHQGWCTLVIGRTS